MEENDIPTYWNYGHLADFIADLNEDLFADDEDRDLVLAAKNGDLTPWQPISDLRTIEKGTEIILKEPDGKGHEAHVVSQSSYPLIPAWSDGGYYVSFMVIPE